MVILFSAALLLFGVCLLYLAALSLTLLVARKLLLWTLQTINIVDNDEDPPKRDVTPQRKRLRDR
jgi:hypothetical protein